MSNWHKLPVELKLMIFEYLAEPDGRMKPKHYITHYHRHKSAYAAVSLEWQGYFERRNFFVLTLSQSDLSDFRRIVVGERRTYLFRLWLRIELPRYTCDSCTRKESDQEATTNNLICTDALWDLFSILAEWKAKEGKETGRLVKLELSVYSPSDREHHFRDHRFHDNRSTYHMSSRIDHDDPSHGWYSGVQVHPRLGPKLRLLGAPLKLDFSHISSGQSQPFPELDFISSLVIPRQFYRKIPGLTLILRSLPNLRRFKYEIWRHVTDGNEWLQEAEYREVLQALPKDLKVLSIFEDSSDVLHLHRRARKFRGIIPVYLRTSSQNLTELNASFLIDAQEFFIQFYPGIYANRQIGWPNLRALTLTSKLLIRPNRQHINVLLQAAALAVLRMPQLEILEIWYGKLYKAGIFRYTRCGDRSSIEWLDTNNPPLGFHSTVVQSWQTVANSYTRDCLDVTTGTISPQCIRSHGSVMHYLKRFERILAPTSTRQLRWEADNLEAVRRRPPRRN
ncbi:hypothetical protein F4677DRAFT_458814 [Hypoxylon crocopeplum]|nr:hypothetical protein F4677DRAFT_458814 [Hypoxylon crocopeplum]